MKKIIIPLILTSVAANCYANFSSQAFAADYPPVCVKMRTEVWQNYAMSMADSWRFAGENNPDKVVADLRKHPLPPDRQRTMLDMASCMHHWNRSQIQSYILWNHP